MQRNQVVSTSNDSCGVCVLSGGWNPCRGDGTPVGGMYRIPFVPPEWKRCGALSDAVAQKCVCVLSGGWNPCYAVGTPHRIKENPQDGTPCTGYNTFSTPGVEAMWSVIGRCGAEMRRTEGIVIFFYCPSFFLLLCTY